MSRHSSFCRSMGIHVWSHSTSRVTMVIATARILMSILLTILAPQSSSTTVLLATDIPPKVHSQAAAASFRIMPVGKKTSLMSAFAR